MDFKDIVTFDEGVIVKEVKNFELAHIFECGQCFRWEKQQNGNYIGIAYEKVIEVEKRGKDLILYHTNVKEFEEVWRAYFDLDRAYEEIKENLAQDVILQKAVDFSHGIRLLQQEPFEMTISFILSANNNIPRIKKALRLISEKWGTPLQYKGQTYYTFPRPEALQQATIEELEACGVGYRAKYIQATVENIVKGAQDLQWIRAQEEEVTYKQLQQLSGIGPKVADCIMLFSMGKYGAFPVDVWIKKAMGYFYGVPDQSLPKIRALGKEKFGTLAGFAQQYLFYYARENKIVV